VNIDFTTATKKDLFKASLEGAELDFGACAQDDYPTLLSKLIEFDLVTYLGQRKHRGDVALFKIEKDFTFKMMETDSKQLAFRARTLNLKIDELLRFTEMIEAQDYNVDMNQMLQRVHSLWVDIPHRPEKRTQMYRKYDFESV